MNHRMWRIVLVPVLVLLFGTVFVFVLSASASRPVLAQGGTGIVRVAKTGTDSSGCGSEAEPCETIQYAVYEAAEGDEIRVAAGTYTGAQQVLAVGSSGVTTFTQVVIVTKSLTLRGGYTTADWNTSDPTQNVTIIDAEGYGRPISIVGDGTQTVTVEGFTITGGNYTELGNPYAAGQCRDTTGDCGGGLFAYHVAVIIRRSVISSNVSSESSQTSAGGGVYLWETLAGTRVEDTIVANNRSLGSASDGGGISLREGTDLTISDCEFVGNLASDIGGAVDVWIVGEGESLIENSEFISNSVWTTNNGRGGGVQLRYGRALVRGSTFISNTGKNGGGLLVWTGSDRPVTLERNVFLGNSASLRGGGVYLDRGSVVTLTNNIIAQNRCGSAAGVYVYGGSRGVFIHNTIAGLETEPVGDGVWVAGMHSTAVFSNNIVVNHTNGIRTNDIVTVTADHTLLYGNDRDLYQASGILSSTNAIVDLDPAFVDPEGYDYHLMCGSPAIDAGADAGVDVDIDGDARPEGLGFDIGADEALTVGRCRSVYLPLVLR